MIVKTALVTVCTDFILTINDKYCYLQFLNTNTTITVDTNTTSNITDTNGIMVKMTDITKATACLLFTIVFTDKENGCSVIAVSSNIFITQQKHLLFTILRK